MQDQERKKREEREKKKAEVRARLEASSTKANKKKGFMTPERKKKLRVSILSLICFHYSALSKWWTMTNSNNDIL